MKGFRQFLLRGNVVDLAVAIVVGAAFVSVVNAFVKDIITPLIAAIGGQPDFSALDFTINNSRFLYGDFINQLLSFVIIAAIVYYLVVLPVNTIISRARREPPTDPTTKKCEECLSEIPIDARRCAFCTAPVASAVAERSL
jgi:large conductance mechanosensitive channel